MRIANSGAGLAAYRRRSMVRYGSLRRAAQPQKMGEKRNGRIEQAALATGLGWLVGNLDTDRVGAEQAGKVGAGL
jgi:hypothetical protein